MVRLMALVGGILTALAAAGQTEITFAPDSTPAEYHVEGGRARVELGSGGLQVRCDGNSRTRLGMEGFGEEFTARAGEGGVAFTVRNESDATLRFSFTIGGTNAGGGDTRHRQTVDVVAGGEGTFPVFTYNYGAGPYWGMHGLPVYGPAFFDGRATPGLEPPVALRALRVEVTDAPGRAVFALVRLQAFAPDDPAGKLVAHPFITEFGQFAELADEYKVHSVEELKSRDAEEAAALADVAPSRELDAYGGWINGPQLEATGHFRTEQVDGRWWLVTPEGRLFFSLGVTCINGGDRTFVTGRDDWFSWIPKADGPYAEFVQEISGVHSRAEPIHGKGTAVNFYGINMARKYGDAWPVLSRERAMARLRGWGFNTVGNWSRDDVLSEGSLPFTVTGHTGDAMPVEASTGYWRKLKDVFDPQFVPNTRAAVERFTAKWRDNPRVIGYFVDNELSWGGVSDGVLASPPEQPARMAFIQELQAKYETLAALNEAWNTDVTTWDGLRLPSRGTDATRADVEALEYRFARRYFETVRDALADFAPGQLYLGCRFTMAYMPPTIVRACADVCDVISMNAYLNEIRPGFLEEYGKPVIIGEFHFGALDRGMFHTGLVPAENQADRAAKYIHYVESVAKSPVFVGCHWFQYMDEPVTGRTHDGENFNIGLVNVCDLPYPELTAAAREVNGRLYRARYEGAW